MHRVFSTRLGPARNGGLTGIALIAARSESLSGRTGAKARQTGVREQRAHLSRSDTTVKTQHDELSPRRSPQAPSPFPFWPTHWSPGARSVARLSCTWALQGA